MEKNLVCLINGHIFSAYYAYVVKGYFSFKCTRCGHTTKVLRGRGRPKCLTSYDEISKGDNEWNT